MSNVKQKPRILQGLVVVKDLGNEQEMSANPKARPPETQKRTLDSVIQLKKTEGPEPRRTALAGSFHRSK